MGDSVSTQAIIDLVLALSGILVGGFITLRATEYAKSRRNKRQSRLAATALLAELTNIVRHYRLSARDLSLPQISANRDIERKKYEPLIFNELNMLTFGFLGYSQLADVLALRMLLSANNKYLSTDLACAGEADALWLKLDLRKLQRKLKNLLTPLIRHIQPLWKRLGNWTLATC